VNGAGGGTRERHVSLVSTAVVFCGDVTIDELYCARSSRCGSDSQGIPLVARLTGANRHDVS
jgi:hypothetical protein